MEVPHQVPAIRHCNSVVLQDAVNLAEELVLHRKKVKKTKVHILIIVLNIHHLSSIIIINIILYPSILKSNLMSLLSN